MIVFLFYYPAPTAPPSTPLLTDLTSQSFSLEWRPPPFEQINGVIRHYTLSIVEMETRQEFEIMTNISRVTVDSLHPFYNYLCKVRAETTEPGPFSGVISILLLEQGEVQLYLRKRGTRHLLFVCPYSSIWTTTECVRHAYQLNGCCSLMECSPV